jgi:hypothetical protein
MAEPEWLNPDYDDDDDEGAPWELTEQDKETAEILIGAS